MYDESQKRGQLLENPFAAIGDRKLDTALRDSTAKCFLQRVRRHETTQLDTFLLDSAREKWGFDPEESQMKINFNLFPMLYNSLHRFKTSGIRNHMKISKIEEIIKKNLNVQVGYLYSKTKSDHMIKSKDELLQQISRIKFTPEISNLIYKVWDSERLVTLTTITKFTKLDLVTNQLLLKQQAYFKSNDKQYETVWNGQLCIIRFEGIYYIMPQAYLLLIHNKFCDILSVLVYSKNCDGTFYERGCYQVTLDFLSDFARLAIRHKEKFLNIAKVLEALGAGLTLIEVDSALNSQFHNYIVQELRDEQGIDIEPTRVYRYMRDSSSPFRHELMCLSKVMGHPFVNMQEGSDTLRAAVTEDRPIDTEYVRRVGWHALKKFIKAYIYKHNRWPPVEFVGPVSEALVHACLMNKDPDSNLITNRYGITPMSDFENVVLGKILEYRKYDNFIPLLKDRTQSVLRSKVLNAYLTNADARGTITWEETRVLLYYLLNSSRSTNHVPYIEEFDREEDMDNFLNYMVIRVVPKEKELKTAYRGFGCQTYMERARRQIQEKNAANFMEMYDSEQALTLSELEITKKLYSFRVIQKAYPGYQSLLIVLDAKKWNSYMRHELINPVAKKVLDPAYGVTHFSKTMLGFECSLIYVPDETKPIASWTGQKGGIEGLHQDTWEHVWTSGVGVEAKEQLDGLIVLILAKGDDTKLAVLVPNKLLTRMTMLQVKERVVEVMAAGAEKIGHKINKEESFGSLHYFSFSKNASIDDIEMPQAFRKIQKAYGANNAFLPTMDEYIGSAFSNAHSSCRVSCHVLPSYIVALYWSCYHLMLSPHYSKLSSTQLAAFLLVPSLLGGLPVIYLHNMFVRAESDLLTPFLSIMMYVKDKELEMWRVFDSFLHVRTIEPKVALKGLLADPYSLPIMKPMNPVSVLRSQISPILNRYGKNEGLKHLIKLNESGINENLIEIMSTLNVFNPKVMALTYASSPEGLLTELTRKFESGRSVCELIVKTMGVGRAKAILRRVLKAEWTLHGWRVKKIKGQRTGGVLVDLTRLMTDCPPESSNRFREVLWKVPVEAITMPDMAHLLYYVDADYGPCDEWAAMNHFHYHFYPGHRSIPPYNLSGFRSAELKPFFGHKTRTNLMPSTLRMVEKDELLVKVQTLIDLIAWTNVEQIQEDTGQMKVSNYPKIIEMLLKIYMVTDPKELAAFRAAKRSGSIQHHVRAPGFREEIMPNVLSNIYLLSNGASNSHVRFRQDANHYRINYLQIYCHTISMFFMFLNSQRSFDKDHRLWSVTDNCDYCNRIIVETPLMVDESLIPSEVTTEMHQVKLSIDANQVIMDLLEQPRKFEKKFNEPSSMEEKYACYAIMQDFIRVTCLSRVKLQDTMNQHHMSDESYSILSNIMPHFDARTIGMTEMSRIPTEILLNALTFYIGHNITYYKNIVTDVGCSLAINSVPAEELEWYEAVRHVSALGLLPNLLSLYQEKTSMPIFNSQHDIKKATIYIGLAAFKLYAMPETKVPPIIHLTSLELTNLPDYLLPQLRFVRRSSIKCNLEDWINHIRQAQDEENIIVILIAYTWLKLSTDDRAIMEIIIGESRPIHSIYKIEWWSHLFLDTDSMQDMVEDESLLIDWMANQDLQYNEPHLWRIAMERILNCTDEIERGLNNICQGKELIFVYTDRVTCINVVRSLEPVKIGGLLDTHMEIDDMCEGEQQPTFRSAQAESILYVRKLNIRATATNPPIASRTSPMEIPQVVKVRGMWLHRPLSLRSTACNKLIQIFNLFGLNQLRQNGVYACMAEGEGGFLASIACRTSQSMLFYNSLRIDMEVETDPTGAKEVCATTNNHFNSYGVNLGYDNLSTQRTYNFYKSKLKNLDGMTVDAEISNPSERSDLLANCCNLYLTCRRNGCSFFIIKLFVGDSLNNALVYGCLSQTCSMIFVVKPKSSGPNNEFYLIAWGSRSKGISQQLISHKIYPSQLSYEDLIEAEDQMYKVVTSQLGLVDEDVNLAIIHNINVSLFPALNFCFPINLLSLTGVELRASISSPTDITRQEWDQISRLLLVDLKNTSRMMLRSLKQPGRSSMQREWFDDTLTYAVTAARRWLTVEGLNHALSQVLNSNDCLSIVVLKGYFDLCLQQLPTRYQGPHRDEDRFLIDHCIANVQSKLYLSFVNGVELCLQWYSAKLCIQR